MKTPDQIAAEMLAGLEGVADGPWPALCFRTSPRSNEAYVLADHIARCDPKSIRALIEDRAMWKERAEKVPEAAAMAQDADILGILRLGQDLLAEEPDTRMAAMCKPAADEIERLRKELT